MIVIFVKDKETRNTVRFTAPQGGVVSGSIYIVKTDPQSKRQEIAVKIQNDDDGKCRHLADPSSVAIL